MTWRKCSRAKNLIFWKNTLLNLKNSSNKSVNKKKKSFKRKTNSKRWKQRSTKRKRQEPCSQLRWRKWNSKSLKSNRFKTVITLSNLNSCKNRKSWGRLSKICKILNPLSPSSKQESKRIMVLLNKRAKKYRNSSNNLINSNCYTMGYAKRINLWRKGWNSKGIYLKPSTMKAAFKLTLMQPIVIKNRWSYPSKGYF